MKSFAQIALPHEDIAKGRFSMDVYAADLWQVASGKASIDYQDPDLFFRKTHTTKGLDNILNVARSRLEGKSGDSVIQLQTPFGGGKTHTLIALYHKAKEWGASVVVLDCTALNPNETKLWEEIEKQISGRISLMKSDVPPGKEKLLEVLSNKAPVLILIDELLTYATKAAGIKVGDSNLAAQTLVFMQELTGAVATLGKALLVVTLPSSTLEHYDENAERMFQQLEKIFGRMEKIYAPVSDDEIEYVIRKRLFSKINEEEAKNVVDEFVDHAKNEGLLSGDEVSEYRNRFLKSYPFKPEVIDVLYKRWGSFPTFQRTRGVLGLLSIVVNRLIDKNIPYVRLGDFDLAVDELKRGFTKHIGSEWDSIIAQDITSDSSGAKRVDKSLGVSYEAYKLGSVVSTTIFLMSFSGKGEKSVGIKDIKLSSLYPDFSSSLIDTTISNLKDKLFYLSDEGLFFTKQPNLNRIIINQEENVTAQELHDKEMDILKNHIKRLDAFKTYIYPKFPKDVPDSPDLKLIILNQAKPHSEFLEKVGETPRVYRNTLVFLCIDENGKDAFYNNIRKFIALERIYENKSLSLTDAQKKEVENKLKEFEKSAYEKLRKYYRKLFVPSKSGFKELDMGVPTDGDSQLDKDVFEYLNTQGEILEKISAKLIENKYLLDKDYLEITKLYDAFLKTPGEPRPASKEAFVNGIKEGVFAGVFGFGYIENNNIKCKNFKQEISLSFAENEIIINPKYCETALYSPTSPKPNNSNKADKPIKEPLDFGNEKSDLRKRVKREIKLSFKVPAGQISTVARIANHLKVRFSKCDIKISIDASGGEIDNSEYEDKILEALKQSGIDIEEE